MKKILFAAFTLITLTAAAHGTAKKHALFVPAAISGSFNSSFPSASTPSWNWDQQYMKATFVENNVSTNAYFTPDGTLEGTIKAASFTDIPLAAQQHISNKYKDFAVKETIFFTDNDPSAESAIFGFPDSPSSYFVSLGKGDQELILKVDPDGTVSYYHEDELKSK